MSPPDGGGAPGVNPKRRNESVAAGPSALGVEGTGWSPPHWAPTPVRVRRVAIVALHADWDGVLRTGGVDWPGVARIPAGAPVAVQLASGARTFDLDVPSRLARCLSGHPIDVRGDSPVADELAELLEAFAPDRRLAGVSNVGANPAGWWSP